MSLESKRAYNRQWKLDHPEYQYRYDLNKRYGITPEQREAMFTEQNGACGICGEVRRLFIDHDHATGLVRKLLCERCNWALGMVEDPEWLAKATKYLAEYDAEACTASEKVVV
jgi:hypothetical protein